MYKAHVQWLQNRNIVKCWNVVNMITLAIPQYFSHQICMECFIICINFYLKKAGNRNRWRKQLVHGFLSNKLFYFLCRKSIILHFIWISIFQIYFYRFFRSTQKISRSNRVRYQITLLTFTFRQNIIIWLQ